jgi:hypothetical protein
MLWHADDLLSASVASQILGDRGVKALAPNVSTSSSPKGRLFRGLRLFAFDVPVAWFFVALNHELGHTFRAGEQGITAHLTLVGGPWSIHPFLLESDPSQYPRSFDPRGPFDFGAESGGMEASWGLKDRAELLQIPRDHVSPGEAMTTVMASLNTPLYALNNLSESDVNGSVDGPPRGDAARYVYQLRDIRFRAGDFVTNTRRQVQLRSMLSFLDLKLWGDLVGLIHDEMWEGRGSVPLKWLKLGPIRMMPSLRYALTPVAPEFSVRSHYRVADATGSAYFRWSEKAATAQYQGGGFSWSRPLGTFLPRISVDGWKSTIEGLGGRLDVEVTMRHWPSDTVSFRVGVGSKSTGYLEGFPMKATTYVTGGATVRIR